MRYISRAEPVARPICVAGPEEHLHSALDDFGKRGQSGTGAVAGVAEGVEGADGAFVVRDFGADGSEDVWTLEIGLVCSGRERVVGWLTDVVGVEIVEGDSTLCFVGGLEGTLDLGYADL